MSLQSTETRIYNWAAWARAGGSVRALGYKSPSLGLLRDNVGGDRWNPPALAVSDDEGMAMDLIVTRLGERDEVMHWALCLHYIVGKSFRDCARAMQDYAVASGDGRYDVSHQTVSTLVQRAVSWIDGHCDGISEMAA